MSAESQSLLKDRLGICHLILCGVGDDIADGGPGSDTVNREDGRDILIGGVGRDDLNGGAGEDIVVGSNVLFPLVHQSLGLIWTEWSSANAFGIRTRNVLGYMHPAFEERLNENEFLSCGVTVGSDGALDEINTLDGEPDVVMIDAFDQLVDDASDQSFCF